MLVDEVGNTVVHSLGLGSRLCKRGGSELGGKQTGMHSFSLCSRFLLSWLPCCDALPPRSVSAPALVLSVFHRSMRKWN